MLRQAKNEIDFIVKYGKLIILYMKKYFDVNVINKSYFYCRFERNIFLI